MSKSNIIIFFKLHSFKYFFINVVTIDYLDLTCVSWWKKKIQIIAASNLLQSCSVPSVWKQSLFYFLPLKAPPPTHTHTAHIHTHTQWTWAGCFSPDAGFFFSLSLQSLNISKSQQCDITEHPDHTQPNVLTHSGGGCDLMLSPQSSHVRPVCPAGLQEVVVCRRVVTG